MSLTEQELILQAQNGSYSAFEELVYRYDKNVLSLALKYTNDEDNAKDIYQEVFIRVYKGLKKFQFRSEFSTWLFRIATNVCLTYKERKAAHTFVSIHKEDDDSPDFDIPAEDYESSPEDMLAHSELKQSVQKALEEIPPKQKMAFLLKHFEGYKIKDIAVMMNCQEGTIKKYLFEAVHTLQVKLKDYSPR
jgi:RNA polymerase sigma-70 factor (ECF subfamily)